MILSGYNLSVHQSLVIHHWKLSYLVVLFYSILQVTHHTRVMIACLLYSTIQVNYHTPHHDPLPPYQIREDYHYLTPHHNFPCLKTIFPRKLYEDYLLLMAKWVKPSHLVWLDDPQVMEQQQRTSFDSPVVIWWIFFRPVHPPSVVEKSSVVVTVLNLSTSTGGWKTHPLQKYDTGNRWWPRMESGCTSGILYDQNSNLLFR